MRILHVIPNPFFLPRGGVLRAARQIRMARGSGAECAVVCYHLGDAFGSIPIYRIPKIPWYGKVTPGATLHRLYLDLLMLLTCFLAAVRFKPDIIHAHLHEGVFIALPCKVFLHIPLLLDAEGSLSREVALYGFKPAALFRMLERLLTGLSDDVVTSSRLLRNYFLKKKVGKVGTFRVITDCIDTEGLKPRRKNRKLLSERSLSPSTPVAVFIGSMDRIQGFDLLPEVAVILQENMPKMRFVLLGGPEEHIWKEYCLRKGIHTCIFTGKVSRADVPLWLSTGNVAFSLKRSGTLQANGKLLDYMAMGLPVVAFNTSANREILGDTYPLVPEGDTEAFAELLGRFLRNRGNQKKYGEYLRNRVVEKYSTEGRRNELMNLYFAMCRGRMKRGT
jgi:glycosyltransferase involved in cell wall biosynthesis